MGTPANLLPASRALIGPRPPPSRMRSLLEWVTGYPADPLREVGPVETAAMFAGALPLRSLKSLVTKGADAALDMSHAARMERAAQQGFGRPLYHETELANVQGLVDEGFDLGRVGARAQDEVMPNGVFLKPTDVPIKVAQDPAQLPLRHRARNLKEFRDRDELGQFLLRDPAYTDIHRALEANEHRYNDEFEALEKIAWRSDAPDAVAARTRLDVLMEEWKASNSAIAARARERSTQLLQATGAEGIRVLHDPGSFGRKVETTVIFDPSHVRSTKAVFDPSLMSSKNLLASLAGFGLIPLSQLAHPEARSPSR